MKKIFTLTAIGFLFLASPVLAENSTSTINQADTIKQLKEQTEKLTAELSEAKKEVATLKEELRITKTLKFGMADKEVKKLQEFLSTMPDVYPEGLVTGYFGSLTQKAVKRLQEKSGLESVGIVGPKTRAKLNELSSVGASSSDSSLATATCTTAYDPNTGRPCNTPAVELKATTTPPGLENRTENRATTTPSGTIPATPAVPSSDGGTTPATPAVPEQTQDTTAPIISNISATTTQTTAIITWTTNELADSRVVISTSTPLIVENLTMATSHNLSFSNLSNGTTYSYVVVSKDASGNTATSSVQSFVTLVSTPVTVPAPTYTTPPVVSAVLASSITSNSAVISWLTDVPATGFVNYGSTPANWMVTAQDNSLTTQHSFTISNLSASTLYNFRVYSHNAYGSQTDQVNGYPPNNTFTTLSGPISCSGINLTLNDGKTTYIKGVDNAVNYTWTCTPGGSANINIIVQKPESLGQASLDTTNSSTQTSSIDIAGSSYPVGAYYLIGCFDVCGSTIAQKSFNIQ